MEIGKNYGFECLNKHCKNFIYHMTSVKPFKSENRDKIDLDAPNPNLKKGCDRDFFATA